MNNCCCGVDEVRPCRGHLNGMIFRFLVYADNIFLTTDSAAEAARRSCEEASVFKSQRLQFNESRLEILPSKATEKDSFSFGLEDGEPFTWVETLQVLGCFLDGTGSTETLAKDGYCRGGRYSTKCGRSCAARRSHWRNGSEGFTPRWVPLCCGALVAGLRR